MVADSRTEDEQRFRLFFEEQDSHWLWTGERNNGYPRFVTKEGEPTQAVRWAYQQWRGPLPAGTYLRHCRKQLCVNPYHAAPMHQHATIPFSFALTPEQDAALRGTGRSWAALIEEAMAERYPSWPYYERRTERIRRRRKTQGGSIHVFLLTPEQDAWFRSLGPVRRGRIAAMIETALAAYFAAHYHVRFPRAARAVRRARKNNTPDTNGRGL